MRPGGFWRRAAAWSLDALPPAALALALCAERLGPAAAALSGAWTTLVGSGAQGMAAAIMGLDAGAGPGALFALARSMLRDPALLAAAAGVQAALAALLAPPLLAFVALSMAWCLGFERSPLRATPGKRALGLRVEAADGGTAGTGRLLLRFLSGALSWLSLNAGHLMAAMPPRHATLHDRISGTRVVLDADAPARVPAWARAWLAALSVGLLLASAWAAAAMTAAMQAALDRALWG